MGKEIEILVIERSLQLRASGCLPDWIVKDASKTLLGYGLAVRRPLQIMGRRYLRGRLNCN